jgi:hypothetical protein
MTPQELDTIQQTSEFSDNSSQVRLTEEELKELSIVNLELIEIEEKSVSEGEVLEKLLEDENFKVFLDMYTTDEAERLSDAITGTASLSSSSLGVLQQMQMSIRYFKQFIISKQNESHGASMRLEARVADKQKIEAGNVFKEVGDK